MTVLVIWLLTGCPKAPPPEAEPAAEAPLADTPAAVVADGAGCAAGLDRVCLEPVAAPTLERPVWFGVAGGLQLVIEKPGRIGLIDGGALRPWADLTDRVREQHTEEGLLSAAFHPSWPDDPRVWLYYSASNPRRTVLAEYRATPDGLDVGSEKVLLDIPQPYGNHNGGDVHIGPDGHLYLAVGDGGSAGDPEGNGQDPSTLLGAVLRLDIDHGEPYGIPADNPFADGRGGRPEIYAWGLRNPWRTSFDSETGIFWVADVGQNRIEEVDIVERGGNYGWRDMEGRDCYPPGDRCPREGRTEPVFQYTHEEGVSITGGHVYRGSALPELRGAYFVADFGSGRAWAVCRDGHRSLGRLAANPSSFGLDVDGELVLVDFGGSLERIVPCR